MSENLGTIYWNVDADTTGAVKSEKALQKQTAAVESQFGKLDTQTKKTSSQLDKAAKSVNNLNTKAGKTEKGVFKLKDQFKSFGRNAGAAVASVDGPLGGVSSRISSLTTLMTTGGVATTTFAAAFAALTYIVIDGVKELDKLNISNARAEALIKATGSAAGKTASELEAQAKSIALNTLAGTEGVQKAQGILLTFKAVQGDVFDRAIVLSQDLASVMGTDISSAALQMGKALNDPLTGMSALTRSGVSFTEQQKDMVKSLVASGNQLEAQNLILTEIESQYSGAAEAVAAGSLAGAIDTLGQSFAEMTAQVAENTGALGIFESTLSRIASGMRNFTEQKLMPDTSSDDFQKALDLMWEIAETEDKLSKTQDKRSRNALKNRIQALKDERQEYLDSASEKAKADNKEIEDKANAIKASEKLRQEASAAAIARTKAEAQAELDKENAKQEKRDVKFATSISEKGMSTLDRLKAEKEELLKMEAKYTDNVKVFQDAITANMIAQIKVRGELWSKENEERQSGLTLAKEAIGGGEQNSAIVQLQEEHAKLLELKAKFVEDSLVYDQALTANTKAQAQERTNATISGASLIAASMGSLFGNIASMMAASGDEQSTAYKAMFAVSKGFAVAQAGLNFALAVSNASAVTPWYSSLAAVAETTAAGAGVVSAVSSAVYSGREHGGTVNAGQTYEVGEKNKPEMLMIPGNNGKVFSNAEMKGMMGGGGGGNPAPIINNYGAANGVSVEHERDAVTKQDVFNIVYSQNTNPNSRSRRAQTGSTNIKSQLGGRRRS